MFEIVITHQAKKDIDLLSPKLKLKLKTILIEILAKDPFIGKRLIGDLEGSYSYRLTYQDRIVYSINNNTKTVYLERARTHYGE